MCVCVCVCVCVINWNEPLFVFNKCTHAFQSRMNILSYFADSFVSINLSISLEISIPSDKYLK